MSGSGITAVVFDLDDTLYPEREYAFSGFDAVAAAFEDHLGECRDAALRMRQLFDTEHRPRIFNALLSQLGPRTVAMRAPVSDDYEELVQRMIQTYRVHAPTISLHEDADAALTRLRETHRLGLVTDGPAQSQSAKINALDLLPRLDAIVLTDELGPGFAKPHPLAFELICGRLKVSARQCAYIADNPAKDFMAPNALGWTTVQIKRAEGIYRDNPSAPGGTPDHLIDTLGDLDTLL